MTKKDIAEKVSGLLKGQGYDCMKDTYIDIAALVTSLGFRVGESSKLPFKDDGFLYITEDKKDMLIVVNNYRTTEEKRFIVAHELAHYILHNEDSATGEAIMHREHVKGKDEQENDADYFAACILMPYESFLGRVEDLKRQNYKMKDIVGILQSIFKTPRESVQRRIEEVYHEKRAANKRKTYGTD